MKRILIPVFALFSAGICLVFLFLTPFPSADETKSSHSTSSALEMSSSFSAFAEELFVQWVQADALNLHYKLASPSGYSISPSEISLGSVSPSSIRQQYVQIQENLEELRRLDYGELSASDRFSYDVLEDCLLSQLKQEDFLLYDEPLGATLGIQAQLPILLSEYAFETETDIQNYLLLLDSTDDYFLSILDFEQQKKEAGLLMDDSCLKAIQAQCLSFCDSDDETLSSHLLITSFEDRIRNLPFSLSPSAQQAYETQNKNAVKETVLPAYAMLADGLSQLEGSCLYPGGLCQKPGGQDYYSLLVYAKTGSSKTVPELYEQTRQRISKNLISIASLCESDSSLSAQLSDYTFSLSEPGDILDYLKTEIAEDFPPVPEDSYTVKYVPDSLSPFTSPAFYLIPPIDESSRNIIYINKSNGFEASRLFPVLAHEGYPGHLYQNTWFSSVNPYPIRALLSYPGYSEGWATYCEFYSYGLETSFSPNLAQLLVETQEATLGLYSLMDMGIHYYGWTTEEIQKTLTTYFGISDEDTVLHVYNSLLEAPGNYLSYYIGYEEIMELRNYAMEKWGEDFTLYRFHKMMLDLGPAPFDLLREQV